MASLRDQVGKQQPFDCPEQEAYLNLIRSAALLGSAFSRLFKQHGLSESGYNVLRIVRGGGELGKTWTEIRDQLVVPAPDVTRLIARLEREGLLCRERSINDRRVVRVQLTETGRARLDEVDPRVIGLHRGQLGHLSGAELDRLSRLLEAARAPHEVR
ncbi:MAG: MarR family transcriptional regulator [Planctomycetota bacterium]